MATNRKLKTLDEVNAEYDAKMAELTGLEAQILNMHDREGQIRTELHHLYLQSLRIKAAGV